MPYIKQEDRETALIHPTTAGELNFAFSTLINGYINTLGVSYQTFNDIIGALEGCKLEVYRRQVADYEDVKIQENGDVYSRRPGV